ncbi:LOW QUALITY PROTEIN: hypothetical protein ACHAWO_000795 [Cyclotella atomus]|uniref:Uncharacterized protein n=1 Tax=Cyclotella atomus TaxID=382360 RepID=A0ABD3P384_9STRA
MHASLLDCCKCYFSWNIIGCLGYSDSSTDSLYYPDLYGNSKTCKADGNAPSYMTTNTYSWMYASLADWFGTCIASGGNVVDTTASLYYPDWAGVDTCVNDGNAPDYMSSNPTEWMYESLVDCCKRYYPWKDEYYSFSGTEPTELQNVGGWLSTERHHCFLTILTLNGVASEICEGDGPCVGIAERHKITYLTKDDCCARLFGGVAMRDS